MKTELAKHDLMALIRKEGSFRMRLKLMAILYFYEGHSRYKIAASLKVSRTSVNKWVSNYLSHGLQGLEDKQHPGRPALLSPFQRQQLADFLAEQEGICHRGKVRGLQVKEYILTTFGVDYDLSNIYRILQQLKKQA
jgi:transposase